uniref:Uncharacterized protein n=1 Tax=Meloidogyne incognita TaxID=6306 RepID=A0A914LV92_MELIC
MTLFLNCLNLMPFFLNFFIIYFSFLSNCLDLTLNGFNSLSMYILNLLFNSFNMLFYNLGIVLTFNILLYFLVKFFPLAVLLRPIYRKCFIHSIGYVC